MKKTKQHYVWRYYLKSWANPELIWCCRDGKIFNSNLMGVAQSRYFYKLNELSFKGMNIIHEYYIKPLSTDLQKSNNAWVSLFNEIFKLKKLYEQNGIYTSETKALVDESICNLEEELHSIIEKGAIPYIDSILNENIDFYRSNKDCAKFAHFISVQYFRTQKMKSNFLKNAEKFDVNIENAWNLLSHIFATTPISL